MSTYEKFSQKINADEDGFYMSCPEKIGMHLANNISDYKCAVELCCAVGMTVIQLANKLDIVYGIDIDKNRIENAKLNAKLYGVDKKTHFICGNVLNIKLLKKIKADIAILDPDWSADANDKSNHVASLEMTQPSTKELFYLVKKYVTKNIIIRIPKTFTFDTLKELGVCRIENIIWDNKIRFKYAYFLEDITKNQEIDSYFNL